jgi:hypothetical protein
MPLSWARLFQSPPQPMSCRCVYFSLLMSLKGSLQVPGCLLFCMVLFSDAWEFLAPRPTPVLKDHFLSAVATANSTHLQLPYTSATLGCSIPSWEGSLLTDFKMLESRNTVYEPIWEFQHAKPVAQSCLIISNLEVIKGLNANMCLLKSGRKERRFLILDIVCWEPMCVCYVCTNIYYSW